MPNSLAFRLFVSFALWMLLVLPTSAFFLISDYRGEVQDGFDERLNQYLINLINQSLPEKGTEIRAPNLGEPLFSLPFSGLYWEIKPLGGVEPMLRSESLVTERLTLPSDLGVAPDLRLLKLAFVEGPEKKKLRVVEREVALSDGPDRKTYAYAVAQDTTELRDGVNDFTKKLIANLSVLGIGIVVATFFQVRYGLAPLRDIGKRLTQIRSGEAEKLEGALPEEIRPLQNELNALILSNTNIIERARTHVGNLAHALKTPLSVIINEAHAAGDSAFALKVAEQAQLMREQINHHLNRARIAARAGVVGGVTPVQPPLAALLKVLQHIYEERSVNASIECLEDIKFQGEKQDFEEMAGNLLDNAFKWAKSAVHLSVAIVPPTNEYTTKRFALTVDDDGPGLPAERRAAVIERGRRFDETKPGSGLGLSIVADLCDLYQGRFSLDRSPSGGLRATLILPAA
jgi:signal transduction histidine kinase